MIKLSAPKEKLGYIWRYCNYAIQLAKETGEEVAVCTTAFAKNYPSYIDKTDLIKEVLENLQYDVKISTHDDPKDATKVDINVPIKYCNTKVVWKLENVDNWRVAYQVEADDIRKWYSVDLDSHKYFEKYVPTKVKLSAEYSVSQIIDILSKSFLYVGADSGISHVAHSVGIPMFIIGDNNSKYITEMWHKGNKYEVINSLKTFTLHTYPAYVKNVAEYHKLGGCYGCNR